LDAPTFGDGDLVELVGAELRLRMSHTAFGTTPFAIPAKIADSEIVARESPDFFC
jgi:hypothetical protein